MDKTDGFALLKKLHKVISQTSMERTAALHGRFAQPKPVKHKNGLALALVKWQQDLEELQEAGALPSKETVVKSLKLLVKEIGELKSTSDLIDLVCPGNLAVMYRQYEKKAQEWAAFALDPRLSRGGDRRQDGNPAGGAPAGPGAHGAKTKMCSFFAKGTCTAGSQCRFVHGRTPDKGKAKGDGGKGKGKGKKGKEKGKGAGGGAGWTGGGGGYTGGGGGGGGSQKPTAGLDPKQCRKCGVKGHWGNECTADQGTKDRWAAQQQQSSGSGGPGPPVRGLVVAQPTQVQEVALDIDDLKGMVSAYMDKHKGGYQTAKGLSVKLKGLMMRFAPGTRLAANVQLEPAALQHDPALQGALLLPPEDYTRDRLKEMLKFYGINYTSRERKPELVKKVTECRALFS